MDHVTWKIDPDAFPYWPAIVLFVIAAALVLGALTIKGITMKYQALLAAGICGLLATILASVGWVSHIHLDERRHPWVYDVADRFNLTYVVGSDNEFVSDDNVHYKSCAPKITQVDRSTLSAKMLCEVDGKPAVVKVP